MPIPSMAFLDLLICAGALALLILLIVREIERVRLASIARAAVPSNASEEEAALSLAREVFTNARERRGGLRLPGLLIAGPLAAAHSQRNTTDTSSERLYIALLDAVGIPARQITLHHRDGSIKHCVVEVALQDGDLIVDVHYGVSYRDFWGNRLGLEQLQRGAPPCFEPLPGLDSSGRPDQSYYELEFSRTIAASDAEDGIHRFARAILRIATLGSASRLSMRPALEWPHVLFALLGLPILAVLALLRLLAGT